MDSPSQEALQDALRQLVLLKAVNSLNEQKVRVFEPVWNDIA